MMILMIYPFPLWLIIFVNHIFIFDFSLPSIRRKLLDSIDYSEKEVVVLMLNFFDSYVSEVRKHMEYEEKTVFKYVDDLLHNQAPKLSDQYIFKTPRPNQ